MADTITFDTGQPGGSITIPSMDAWINPVPLPRHIIGLTDGGGRKIALNGPPAQDMELGFSLYEDADKQTLQDWIEQHAQYSVQLFTFTDHKGSAYPNLWLRTFRFQLEPGIEADIWTIRLQVSKDLTA